MRKLLTIYVRAGLKRKRIMTLAVSVVAALVLSVPGPAIALPTVESLDYFVQGGNLSNTCDYSFWYGCSPTSAGMMIGYYDRNGYNGSLYDNLAPGGVAEQNTYGAGPYLANNAIASAGHIADFYSGGYLASGDDVSPPSHSFDCLADFMGTSQDSVGSGNRNSWTTFWYYTDGSPLTEADIYGYGPYYYNSDGMYGLGEYVNYAGYDTITLYTQLIDTIGRTYGFTFDQYKAEIDAGRPLMIHVEGHSLYGYGYYYNPTTDEPWINVYDTLFLGGGSMLWGGTYYGLLQWGVTVMELTNDISTIPAPGAILLGTIGAGLVGWLRRRRMM